MSGGGGSKPEEVKASEGEKQQARLARDQIDYYRSTYAPLEQRSLSEANRDYSGRLSGQAASAGMRESTQGLRAAALSGASMDTTGVAGAISSGTAEALRAGKADQSQRRLEAMGVGLGLSGDATRSLSQAGSIQTSNAIDQVRAEWAEEQAKNDSRNAAYAAMGSAAGTYIGYKAPEWQHRAATQKKANETAKTMQTKINNGTAYKGAHGFY